MGRFGIAVNAAGLELITVVWAGELIVGPCPLKAKLAWDPLNVFSNTGMGVVVRLTDRLSRTDFREPRVVSLTSFFPLAWLYSSISIGSCLTDTLGVVTTLVDTESGGTPIETLGGTPEETIAGLLTCWDTTVALMVLPFELSTEIGYIFIVLAGFGCFIVADPVTHLCEKCQQESMFKYISYQNMYISRIIEMKIGTIIYKYVYRYIMSYLYVNKHKQ